MTSDVAPEPPTTQPAAMPGRPADIGDRFLARLIDAGVVIGAMVVPALCAQPLEGRGGAAEALGVLLSMLMLTVYLGYEFVMIGRYGQTFGKRVMKLRVVRADGTTAGWGASALRVYVPMIASVCTCNLGGILFYLSPLFDSSPWKRGWYDQLASTVVVRAENSEWRW